MAETYSAGIVTAYGAAVRGGYDGTYEQWCEDMAQLGDNVAEVREKAEQVEQTAQEFTEQTVPAAIQAVEDKGTEQVNAVGTAGAAQVQQIDDTAVLRIGAVNAAGAAQVQAVEDAGDDVTEAVEAAGTAATSDIYTAKAAALTALQNESFTQQTAIQQKGEDTRASIPDDYTALSDEVVELKSAVNQEVYLLQENIGQVNYYKATDVALVDVTGAGAYRAGCDCGELPPGNYILTYKQRAGSSSVLYLTTVVGSTYTQTQVTSSPFTLTLSASAKVLVRSNAASLSNWDFYDVKLISSESRNILKEIDDTNERIIANCYTERTASGNPILLKDSADAPIKMLTADGDCIAAISGKNMLSPDFNKVTLANRADETIIYGKGAYEYTFPSRVTVTKCADNTITLTPTTPNVITTGVGIFVKVRPSTKYILSYDKTGSGTASVMFYDSSKTYSATEKESAPSGYSFTTTATTYYVCISFRGTTENSAVTFTNMQLEEGDIVTEFTLYQQKKTVPIASGVAADVNGISTYNPVTHIESTSDVTITIKYYATLKNDNAVLIEDIQKNAFVSSYNILDGWEPHAKAFAEMMLDVEKTEGFMFFTDTHFMAKQTESAWKEYAYAIFAYLEQLYYAAPCSFVLHGGDWLGSGEAKASAIYKLSTLNGIFRSRFNKFALLVGNHETGNQMQGNTPMTHDTLAATLLANVGKTYYKFHANTFEMYCFDSWVSGELDSYANEQIAWFADSLMNETAKHMAIAVHILYDEGTLKPFGNELTKCAAAYNSRTTYTYNGNTFNFGNVTGNGKVGFVIAGHEHGDASGTVNGIPYIMTINTTGYSETTFANLPLPVDLMKVDWSTKKLTAYRAARGTAGTIRELTILA